MFKYFGAVATTALAIVNESDLDLNGLDNAETENFTDVENKDSQFERIEVPNVTVGASSVHAKGQSYYVGPQAVKVAAKKVGYPSKQIKGYKSITKVPTYKIRVPVSLRLGRAFKLKIGGRRVKFGKLRGSVRVRVPKKSVPAQETEYTVPGGTVTVPEETVYSKPVYGMTPGQYVTVPQRQGDVRCTTKVVGGSPAEYKYGHPFIDHSVWVYDAKNYKHGNCKITAGATEAYAGRYGPNSWACHLNPTRWDAFFDPIQGQNSKDLAREAARKKCGRLTGYQGEEIQYGNPRNTKFRFQCAAITEAIPAKTVKTCRV